MPVLRRWAIAGLFIGFSYGVLAYAPASWLSNTISQKSQGHIQLTAPRGTMWQGSADLSLTSGQNTSTSQQSPTLASRIYWHIRPLWLGVEIQINLPCCMNTKDGFTLTLRIQEITERLLHWHLQTAQVTLPAQLLTELGAPWNTLEPDGKLELNNATIKGSFSTQGLQNMSGNASIKVHNLSTALSTVKPLGSYDLVLKDTQITLTTMTESSTQAALILSGQGQILKGRVHFSGEALAETGREEALSNLLHTIGQWQPSEDGRSRAKLQF